MQRDRSITRTFDANRLAIAATRPGIDPRCWIAYGTVEEITFTPIVGYVVAVSFVGGPLNGEGPIPCTVAAPFARLNAIGGAPFSVGDLAVVVIPEGDANVDPIVIGFVNSPEQAPSVLVNLQPVTAAFLEGAHVLADPTKALEVEVLTARLNATLVQLASPAPTQAYLRGTVFAAALSAYLSASATFATTAATACATLVTASVGPLAPLVPGFTALGTAFTTWGTAISTLQGTASQWLSAKIFGE